MVENPYCYSFPRPVVSVDGVIFGFDPEDKSKPLKVLLIRRGEPPFKGEWALPGGKLEVADGTDQDTQGEDLEYAARRELEEETNARVAYLEQLGTFGTPGRDPRCRVIAVAYYALVRTADCTIRHGDDAADAQWVCAFEALGFQMAFDHADILKMAVQRLQAKVRYAPIGFNLLPEAFTLRQLQDLYEAILRRPLEKRNFQRRIMAMGILSTAGVTEQKGKVTNLYTFNRTAYEQATVKGLNFEV